MESQIIIRSGEPDVRKSLFGDRERTSLQLDDAANATVSLERHRELRLGEFSDILQLAVDWAGSAGAAVTASWLYDHLKDKKASISIVGSR